VVAIEIEDNVCLSEVDTPCSDAFGVNVRRRACANHWSAARKSKLSAPASGTFAHNFAYDCNCVAAAPAGGS